MNFQPEQFVFTKDQNGTYTNVYDNKGLSHIGVWDPKTYFTECKECGCSPVFNTPDNSVPLYRPNAIVEELNSAMIGLLIALFVISILMLMVFAVVMFIYRKSRLVKASQPGMMMFVFIGGLLGSFFILNQSFSLDDTVCRASRFLGHSSFFFIFVALEVKTWRVHMIVNSSMRKVKITNQNVLQIVGVIITLLIIYLIIFLIVGDPHVNMITTLGTMQSRTISYQCDDKIPGFSVALNILEIALLALGGYFCYSTRNVPGAVNESKYIGIGII